MRRIADGGGVMQRTSAFSTRELILSIPRGHSSADHARPIHSRKLTP